MAGTPDDIRKLRRQKLLQNSEQRLKKILHSDAGSSSLESCHFQSTHLLNDDGNTTSPREVDSAPNTAVNSSARPQPDQMEATTTNNSNAQDDPTAEAAAADTDRSHIRKRVKTNDAFAESRFPGISNSTPSPSPSPRRSQMSSGNRSYGPVSNKVTLSLLQFDLIRLVSCIVLALLTRKILNTAWSLFFAESILVPFTLLQLGIYTFLPKFCKAVVLPERGSMIASCLVLCGIDQGTVATFNKAIGYSASIADDVAVYIFSFVMADFLIG